MPAREFRIAAVSVSITSNTTINRGPNAVEIEPLSLEMDDSGGIFVVVRRTLHVPSILNPVTRLVVVPTLNGPIDLSQNSHYFGSVFVSGTGFVHAFIRSVRGT